MDESNDSLLRQVRKFSEFTDRLEGARQVALLDTLTGLASRGAGEACIRVNLEAEIHMAVLLLDLDGFKEINARLGHSYGDQVLKSVSKILTEYSEGFDIVSRWAGDKFLMISKSREIDPEEKARTLRLKLCQPYPVTSNNRSTDVIVNVSIGVAKVVEGDSLDNLIDRAEEDLHRNRQIIRQTALLR